MNQMQMQSYSQQSHNFMGPMNFHTPRTGRSNYYPQSPYFGDLAPGIGIGYPTQSLATYENPYATYSRSPSAKLDTGLAYKDMFIQPQFHSEFPTGNMGLNFSTSDSSSEMERMYY